MEICLWYAEVRLVSRFISNFNKISLYDFRTIIQNVKELKLRTLVQNCAITYVYNLLLLCTIVTNHIFPPSIS